MGYTHYYYAEREFNKAKFKKVVDDFKKMIPVLKHLGVKLADAHGENFPKINYNVIAFNGLLHCGHTQRDLGITWPSKTAKGVSKNGVGQQLQEIVKGHWFAGAQLESRVCGGDCSHESFFLEQKLTGIAEYKLTPEALKKNKGKIFQCTKTAYKPYDLAVNICLIIAKHYLKDQILVHSDGELKDWQEGMQLCQHFLGFGKNFVLDEDDEK